MICLRCHRCGASMATVTQSTIIGEVEWVNDVYLSCRCGAERWVMVSPPTLRWWLRKWRWLHALGWPRRKGA